MRTIHTASLYSRLVMALFLFVWIFPALAQRSVDESASHGNQAEIVVTLRDQSGQLMTGPAFVSLSRSGFPASEAAANRGRAMFLTAPGDYTVQVNASGYKNAQKEVSAPMPMTADVDIVLERKGDDSATVSTTASLLAPKAREALDKGFKALAENNLHEADKYIGEAMKLAPQDPQVLYAEGFLQLKKQDWAGSESTLRKSTQMDPNNAQALSALGMAMVNQQKYEPAIPVLEKSLKLDPKSGYQTRWALGKAYYYHGQYDNALQTSQTALTESAGKAPEIEMLVAKSLVAVGRYEDSAQALRDFLKNHGNDPEAATAKRWLQKLAADGKIRND